MHGWDSFNAPFRRGSYQHAPIDGRWGRAREAVVISAPRCRRSDADFSPLVLPLSTFVVIVAVVAITMIIISTVIIVA